MIELFNTGAYLLNGTELVKDDADAQKVLASKNINVTKEEAAKNTIAYGILEAHNTSLTVWQVTILLMLVLSRQPEHLVWKSSQFLMFLQIAITHFVQLVVQ